MPRQRTYAGQILLESALSATRRPEKTRSAKNQVDRIGVPLVAKDSQHAVDSRVLHRYCMSTIEVARGDLPPIAATLNKVLKRDAPGGGTRPGDFRFYGPRHTQQRSCRRPRRPECTDGTGTRRRSSLRGG